MGFKSPEDAAVAASLSMLLEVSGNPKAGNVDREHDFSDLKYEHFLASATASLPIFIEVAKNRRIGEGIYRAVEYSKNWYRATNVHFGAYLLLIPLLTAWDCRDMYESTHTAVENLKKTTWKDSVLLLKAFKICKARVVKAKELTLESDETEELLIKDKINVYKWMLKAPKENLIAKELTRGYEISLKGAEFILNSELDVNDRIVFLYHDLLSKHLDPLVISKAGIDVAIEVRKLAEKAIKSDNPFERFRKLDEKLLAMDLNPGTIADIVISSIYLAMLEGWRV